MKAARKAHLGSGSKVARWWQFGPNVARETSCNGRLFVQGVMVQAGPRRASMRRLSSDAHNHFHPPRPGHGQYRFCIHCWRGRESEIPSDLSGVTNPGQELPGCIKAHNSSLGSLLKHARTHGFCLKRSVQEGKCDELCDEGATRDWVHAHILQDLQPLGSSDRAGSRRFQKKYMPGARLGGRRKARTLVKEFAEQCRGIIKQKVLKALDRGCKLTLGVDTWKNKSKKRRHYNLLLAWWIDPN